MGNLRDRLGLNRKKPQPAKPQQQPVQQPPAKQPPQQYVRTEEVTASCGHIIREGPFAGALFLRTEDDSACFVIDRVVHVYSLHRGQGTLTYMGSFRDENGTPRRPRRRNGSSPA